ncbi:MAG: dihydrofolate reductase family protein [Bradyrhizobiaceae bacterium]|nr:dihydrofolate reductase family protein [Bradyrhizobiaceae bacterium]
MKTQYYTATTLDGFLATPDDSLEWLFALPKPEGNTYADLIANIGALVMGSATYEWVLAHSGEVEAETGSSWPYQQPTFVFSTREQKLIPGADIRIVQGDVRQHFPDIKSAASNKNIWIVGGGDLAGQFYDAHLLDELILHVGAATLGTGKPLFPRLSQRGTLHITSVHHHGPGFAEIRVEVKREGAEEWESK